ncbi:MAG TPA: hypothetical protein QF671_05175 [Candidatus Thalassarchaeaceae archaeon]|jgi:hypothetical protein|nr:hypothetical protein [Candidatus Thalassarchaeaceae archaeon]
MSIFKVEFTIWLGDGSPGVCARDHIDHDLDSWILDWEETEMYLTPVCEGCPECGGKP